MYILADLYLMSGVFRWESVMSNIHRQNRMAPVAKPGHFNDPDMLQVGNVGLTVTEQYSHMSLWCVASAPLLVGTDVIHASDVTLDILANPEVTAINQDLGRKGAIQVICCLVVGNLIQIDDSTNCNSIHILVQF